VYKKLRDKILNKKIEPNILIGTVDSLNPLMVTLITGDTAIPVVETTGLIGLKIGSRVVLQRFLNQFIAIAIIGKSAIRLIQLNDPIACTSTTLADTDLSFSFEANCKYDVFLTLGASGNDSNGIKLDWLNTGTIPSNQVRRTNGQAFGETNRANTNTCLRQSYLTTDINYGCDNYNTIMEWFVLETTTAGIMTLRAAKYSNSVPATDTNISASSYIVVKKIA
jgi:hypothetical protein